MGPGGCGFKLFATWKTFTRSPCLLLFDERMVTLKNFVEGVFAVGVRSRGDRSSCTHI